MPETLTPRRASAIPGSRRRACAAVFLKFARIALIPFLALATADVHAESIKITAARVWPAQDYTRVTLETTAPVEPKLLSLKNPERLVLDLDNVHITSALKELVGKIGPSDPYVQAVRIGRFKSDTVRLVFDLKTEVKPQAFTLAPVGDYGYRLVLDIYPIEPPDPLLAFLDQHQSQREAAATPGTAASDEPDRRAVIEPAVPDKATGQPGAAPAVPGKVARAESGQPRPNPGRFIIVAVDAGHGGEDPGARGRHGTREKNVTLAIARKLKARIDQEPNMRAVMIRNGDYFIPLHMRVQKARRAHADLFVSIHADAFIKPHARGSSVFALSERGATSAAARWLAKQENDADLIGGVNLDVPDPYLKRTLLDLSQTATLSDSLKLARAVLNELGEINPLHKPHVEQAGFAVLKAPDIPSILVETAFISNPDEERKLKSQAYQEKMADAIFAGIRRYFSYNPPLARDRLVQNP